MIRKIGVRTLETIKPLDRPYHVHDSEVRGFLIRVQPSGEMTYYFDYRLPGKPKRRFKIGNVGAIISPAQARDRAKELASEVLRGIDPRDAKWKTTTKTLGQYIDQDFGPWAEVNRKSGARNVRRTKSQFKQFLNCELSRISPMEIDKWRSQRLRDGISKATINRDMIPLKALLAKAKEWRLIQEHPLQSIKPYRVDDAGRTRFFTEEEESRLRSALTDRETRIRSERVRANNWRQERNYENLPPLDETDYVDHLMPMVLLAMNTGLRRGEVCNLKKVEVDLDRRMISIAGGYSKSGKTRHVPLNDEALSTLSQWLRQNDTNGSGLVFPSPFDGKVIREIKTAWNAVLRNAKIEGACFHTLRHHFASRLAINGVALNTIRELLGHSDIKMTLVYAHLSPSTMAAAVATLTQPPSAAAYRG